MKLKNATLIALIGSALLALGQLPGVVSSFTSDYFNPISVAMNLLFFLGYIGLVIFFSSLYKNQN